MDFLKQYDVILASQSPRRKELLSGLDISFRTLLIPDIDESYPEELRGEDIAKYISKKKADVYLNHMDDHSLVITADTIVLLDGKVFGKPVDDEEAKQMLRELSGNTHLVITGVTITTLTKQKTFSVTTEVRFSNLSEEEIEHYVSHYHPLDKAGAYGIQEWIGYVAVENISGSYFNVMGLPIQRLYKELQNFC